MGNLDMYSWLWGYGIGLGGAMAGIVVEWYVRSRRDPK